ncbi:MAG: phage holin family protein [Verrucomicrobiota bacterium]
MKRFFQRWLINTLAVLVAAFVVRGISYDSTVMDLNGFRMAIPTGLIVATLVLGILNAFLRPILLLLSLPLLIFTLGLFTLVINAIVLLVVGWLLQPHFVVDGFGSAFWAALIISIVSLVLNWITGTKNPPVAVRKESSTPPGDDGNGPVIDV